MLNAKTALEVAEKKLPIDVEQEKCEHDEITLN
jgi:ribosomal protein L16/L10AE